MLKINLKSFDDRKEFSFVLKKEDVSFENDDITIEDGMKVRLALTKDSDSSVIVEGEIEGKVKSVCSRCLEEYSYLIKSAFASIFREKSAFTEEDEQSGVNSYENHMLDLYEFIRETIIIELPLKPLCREECRGLCPVCGKNQNKETCSCDKNETVHFNPFKEL